MHYTCSHVGRQTWNIYRVFQSNWTYIPKIFVCDQNCGYWAQGSPFSKIGSKVSRIPNCWDVHFHLFITSHIGPATYKNKKNCLWPKLWLLGPRTPFSKIGSKIPRIQNFRDFLLDLFINIHFESTYQK